MKKFKWLAVLKIDSNYSSLILIRNLIHVSLNIKNEACYFSF